MKLKTPLLLLLLLVALSGCHTGKAQTPEETGEMPYGKWGFVFFTPESLPAFVSMAMIIDNKNVMYAYRTLDPVRQHQASVGKWHNSIVGYAQFNKARHPPVSMLFCWDSLIDRKLYETLILFPPSMRDAMLKPTGVDRLGDTAWYKTILFGLAPEGKVRIWLQDDAVGKKHLLPVEPLKITTTSGDKLQACKGKSRMDYSRGPGQYIKDFIKDKTYPYGEW